MSVQSLYHDIPREGIDNWIYVNHFRQGLKIYFERMKQTVDENGRSYLLAVKSAYLSALSTIEKEMEDNYEISTSTEQWKDETLIF